MAAVVALARCTEAVAFAATLPSAQLSADPSSAQLPGPLYAGLMLQPIPDPDGSVALSVAEVATAVPVLPAVKVTPIADPAETEDASAIASRLNEATVDWLKRVDASFAVKARL